mgnify:CR=1 FL=1
MSFFKRILFCYITGNEDMHLKNFSVITKAGKTTLTPVYDFINSSILINNPQEELALSLKGKKSNFKATELLDYYAKERLELNNKTIDSILFDMNKKFSIFYFSSLSPCLFQRIKKSLFKITFINI